jgi:hypothetical protein
MHRTVLPFLIAILGPPALPVLAQEPSAPPVTRYDFKDHLLAGDLVRPDILPVAARLRLDTTTLLRVRDSFHAELVESAERL